MRRYPRQTSQKSDIAVQIGYQIPIIRCEIKGGSHQRLTCFVFAPAPAPPVSPDAALPAVPTTDAVEVSVDDVEAELEAWVKVLMEGASRVPLARVSGEALIDLILSY